MNAAGIDWQVRKFPGYSMQARKKTGAIRLRNFVILMLVAITLQACGHAQIARALDPVANIDVSKPVDLTEGMGMVVGSVTAPRIHHYWEMSTFYYRGLDGSETGQMKSASPVSNILWWKDVAVEPGSMGPDPGLDDQLGRLFAIKLKAGTYEIFKVVVGHFLSSLNPVRFEVTGGEIGYIGNLHMRFCRYAPSDRRAYRSYVNGGIPQVRDNARRDLRLLARKFPLLEGLHISTSVVDDEAWRDLPGPADSVCP